MSRVVFELVRRRSATANLPDSVGPIRPELADVARLGRRLLRLVVAAARADERPTPARVLADHLGPQAASLPVVGENWAIYDHVNLQGALELWTQAPGRESTLLGLTNFQHAMFTLADLAQAERMMHGPSLGAVAMSRLTCGPGGATRACVQCGLYLVSEGGSRLALLVREGDPRHGREEVTLELLCADADRAAAALGEIRALALEHSVFRGQVLSFDREMFGPRSTLVSFHQRPTVSREALVLPSGVLEAVEAQVMAVARHRRRLTASGQHLKRGVLLHGPPGTGKTHTLRYLISRMTDTTVVMLSGDALQYIAAAVSIARALQPALVIVEDVDLIAEERGMHPGQHPLLFQLLNEMDGLGEDADVTFLLTTNRADLLEPALTQRPGRVDQAVELPLPDAEGRRQLLSLYRGNLDLHLVEIEPIVTDTDGVTASFFKELMRRAALLAAEQPDASPEGPLSVGDSELRAALDQLLDERNQLTRTLLGGRPPDTTPDR